MPSLLSPTTTLNNGQQIPIVGLGTWQLHGDEKTEFIKKAIDLGYRHFDTAWLYNSEKVIGDAIRQKIADGTVKREDLFITTKLWCSYAHPDLVVKACRKSLSNLGLDYLDLFLIHWPFVFKSIKEYFPRDLKGNLIITDDDYVTTWKEMEKCVELGLTKSIGVSNFNSVQIERLLESAKIKPVTNQIEAHPYLNQKKLIEFCHNRDIIITSYGPLGGMPSAAKPESKPMLENPIMVKIAREKNKTTAQISLRYLIQCGTIVIPKTSSPKRLLENLSVFDFTLTPEEMAEIDSINKNERIYKVPG
ncbi:aldose reductase, putative [Pediculus humanus corporis]|uniref:Aldose reductase, putative n=1 Tax=Pediculus humanus subsp. corporis TaxID=121224 RepID=E0VNI0_PEDHC|nr:aldose reductase, putative [Pediculus humanus corporis]EEB14936.1 aldose reductase, putative [Pediculus humanus corporis]